MILLAWALLTIGCLAIAYYLASHPGEERLPQGGNGYREVER